MERAILWSFILPPAHPTPCPPTPGTQPTARAGVCVTVTEGRRFIQPVGGLWRRGEGGRAHVGTLVCGNDFREAVEEIDASLVLNACALTIEWFNEHPEFIIAAWIQSNMVKDLWVPGILRARRARGRRPRAWGPEARWLGGPSPEPRPGARARGSGAQAPGTASGGAGWFEGVSGQLCNGKQEEFYIQCGLHELYLKAKAVIAGEKDQEVREYIDSKKLWDYNSNLMLQGFWNLRNAPRGGRPGRWVGTRILNP